MNVGKIYKLTVCIPYDPCRVLGHAGHPGRVSIEREVVDTCLVAFEFKGAFDLAKVAHFVEAHLPHLDIGCESAHAEEAATG
jgi:hypothetical protein